MTFGRTAFFILLFGLTSASVILQANAAHAPRKPELTDPSYTSCRMREECLVVRPPCSAPITVNVAHFEEVHRWFEYLRPFHTCADWIPLPDVKTNSCIKNRCTLELTEPKAPEPDNSPQAKDEHYCDKDRDCTVVLGDCCVKNFVNTKNADRLRAEIRDKALLATCFYPDRRHVKNLRCEEHKCTADLEVPLELPDPTHMSKMRCEQ
jgi:hypothetical protein